MGAVIKLFIACIVRFAFFHTTSLVRTCQGFFGFIADGKIFESVWPSSESESESVEDAEDVSEWGYMGVVGKDWK